LLNTLATIAEKGAGFRSLADAWADTTTPHGRLMLTVLGGLAEFERELIRARTSEGRKRAKAAGVHVGRPPKLSRHQQREAIERRDAGETLTDIARTYGVSHTTIMRLTARPLIAAMTPRHARQTRADANFRGGGATGVEERQIRRERVAAACRDNPGVA
jgi:DNA invertase Pin-like site-specific DNA recombinase